MLSSEPPDEGCAGAVGCCGAATTGLRGAAGWEKRNAMMDGTSVVGVYHQSTEGLSNQIYSMFGKRESIIDDMMTVIKCLKLSWKSLKQKFSLSSFNCD